MEPAEQLPPSELSRLGWLPPAPPPLPPPPAPAAAASDRPMEPELPVPHRGTRPVLRGTEGASRCEYTLATVAVDPVPPPPAAEDDPGQGPAFKSLVNMSAALDLDSPAAWAKISVTVLRRWCWGCW